MQKKITNEFIGQQINYLEEGCVKRRQITIDGLELDRVDLLKIDVEGMEIDVLGGAEATLKKHMPQLYIEVIKSDSDEMKSILRSFGYRYFSCGDNLLAVHESDKAGSGIVARDGSLQVESGGSF
jgi:hypothetical protein